MTTIRLYHATNVSIDDIGKSKKTMYFTGTEEHARTWGDEHYEEYDIITVEVPLSNVHEFKGFDGRGNRIIYDFEMMELPSTYVKCNEYWDNCGTDIIHCEDCSDGYIIRDITKYELDYC